MHLHSILPRALGLLSLTAPAIAAGASPYHPALVARDNSTCGYPTKAEIGDIFAKLASGDSQGFLAAVSPTVNWTVEGTHPLAGNYLSRDVFYNSTIVRLFNYESKTDPLKIGVGQITGGGDCDPDAVVELTVRGSMANGLVFNNNYAWVCKFDQQKIITQVRAYLDSELVSRAVVTNEVPFYTFSDPRNASMEQVNGPPSAA